MSTYLLDIHWRKTLLYFEVIGFFVEKTGVILICDELNNHLSKNFFKERKPC